MTSAVEPRLYLVEAFNTATESENKIHSDDVAASYGFTGGLVPGVDVYAYLAHLPAEAWGLGWLREGSLSARFHRPVYDGDTVSVTAAEREDVLALELRDSGGDLCATAQARRLAPGGDDDDPGPGGPVPSPEWVDIDRRERPAAGQLAEASPESLARGTVLGAFGGGFRAGRAGEYLADVRERLPLYAEEAIAHPGWVLRFANWVLSHNVALGPWIHVGSAARFLDVVRDGEEVEARAVVTDEHERGGHRFVVLDVAITAAGRPVQRVNHTAIYRPRRGPRA